MENDVVFLQVIVVVAIGIVITLGYASFNRHRQTRHEESVMRIIDNMDGTSFDYELCDLCYRCGFTPLGTAMMIKKIRVNCAG